MSSVNLLPLQVYAFGQAGCNPPQKPDEVKQYIDDLGSKDQKNGWRIRLRGEQGLLRVLRSNERLEKKVNIINELLKHLGKGDYEKRKAIIRILVILLRSEKSDSSLFFEVSLRQRIADSFIRIFDQSPWGIKELLVLGLSTLVKRGLSDELNSKILFLLVASAKSDNWRIKAASIESLGSLFKYSFEYGFRIKRIKPDWISLNLQRQIETKKNEVIPVLIAIMKDQHSVGIIKFLVAKLLIKLEAREQAIPALITTLRDSNRDIRYAVAELLGELKAKKAILALIEALKDSDGNVKSAATEALVKLQVKEAIPALMVALRDSSVRYIAAKALIKLGASKQAIPVLIATLKDGWVVFKEESAKILGELKAREAIPALIEALKDRENSYKVREAAAKALGELQAKEAILALIEVLNHHDSDVRVAAVEALGKLKAREAIPALIILALRDGNRWVRGTAAKVLGELKAREAIPALIVALKDPHWSEVRAAAAKALGGLKARQAVPALIIALNDEWYSVRRAAARALGGLKAREAIPALILASKDTDWVLRAAAAEALSKIRGIKSK